MPRAAATLAPRATRVTTTTPRLPRSPQRHMRSKPGRAAERQPLLRTPQPWLRSQSTAEYQEVEDLEQFRREERWRESRRQFARPPVVQELSHEDTKITNLF